MSAAPRLRLTKLHVENFKSIENITLDIGDVTVLVGKNGAGKSNIVSALQFLSDAVGRGLSVAIGAGGGIDAVRRQTPGKAGRPPDMRLELLAEIRQERIRQVGYGFTIRAVTGHAWSVKDEWVSLDGDLVLDRVGATLKRPTKEHFVFGAPEFSADQLIARAFGAPGLVRREFLARLGTISTYSIAPDVARPPQRFSGEERLAKDGSNLYHSWARFEHNKEQARRVVSLFSQVVPGVGGIRFRSMGQYGTIEIDFDCGKNRVLTIDGSGLSDGALRALGILVAVFHPLPSALTCIEEPEVSVHPYAAGRLLDAILSGQQGRQLVLTTQSPTLLDESAIRPEMLRIVEWREGRTLAGPIDARQMEQIRERLVKESELLTEGAIEMQAPTRSPSSLKPRG